MIAFTNAPKRNYLKKMYRGIKKIQMVFLKHEMSDVPDRLVLSFVIL